MVQVHSHWGVGIIFLRSEKKKLIGNCLRDASRQFPGAAFFLFIRDIGTAEEPTGPTGLALPIANRAFPFFQLLL